MLRADWKITTKTGDSVQTEYFKGSLVRTDSVVKGRGTYVMVIDYQECMQTSWRTDLRQYAVVYWPAEPPRNNGSGPVISIDRTTTDTGERRNFFGRTARHLITRERRDQGPESVTDGWYIDEGTLPKFKRGMGTAVTVLAIFSAGNQTGPPRIEVHQNGPAPTGLPVLVKRTSTTIRPDGSSGVQETTTEVTELVERTLPKDVFEPPSDYNRVIRFADDAPLTWKQSLELHWQMLEDWVHSLFGR